MNECLNESQKRDKALDFLLDQLYFMGEQETNMSLHDTRFLICDIMEVLSNPAVSNMLEGTSKIEGGKFLNRLQRFYSSMIEANELQELIEKHGEINYSERN